MNTREELIKELERCKSMLKLCENDDKYDCINHYTRCKEIINIYDELFNDKKHKSGVYQVYRLEDQINKDRQRRIYYVSSEELASYYAEKLSKVDCISWTYCYIDTYMNERGLKHHLDLVTIKNM